ncbi:MAG: glycine zipper domain-containing protein [Polyangiaceae bacterium]|nr:glycine zipper domain-containing protein [Polyangiaceae bacterium]
MTRILALSLALATAVSATGCQTPQQQNAFTGGTLGSGAGALIGSAVSHAPGGALAGAAIGAATGAAIGAAATPRPTAYGGQPPRRCAHWAYDYYGDRFCARLY